jgi:tetratricopeptide (TPR) repeat protein
MAVSSSRRLWVFRALLLIIPVALFVSLEIVLQAFSYGGPIDLVVSTSLRGREYLSLNREIGMRIFGRTGPSHPQPTTVYFPARKPPHRKRIFCVGESTMQGFPYEFNATPAAFLENRLRRMLPHGDSVEVINAGLSAVGSFVIVDFLRELVRYEPDLIIVYSGHNEFYGAYGAASTVGIRGPAWLTRLHLRLLHFRTYLLARDAFESVRSWFSRGASSGPETLMGQMAGNGRIPRESTEYRKCLQEFGENLEEMAAVARNARVPILFSALVCNLRDQQPFLPDSSAARSFEAGRDAEANGRWREAHAAYQAACDGDELRFRAASDFEEVLRAVCSHLDVPLAPVDSLFEAASPHGLVGNSLILEHLHPNLAGYELLADGWAGAVSRHRLLGPALAPPPGPGDSSVVAADGITRFDSLVGQVKVGILKNRWPFVTGTAEEYRAANQDEEVILRAMREGRPWSETRYRWADRLVAAGKWPEARAEYQAVARSLPWSFQPWVRLGDAGLSHGDLAGAEADYRRAIEAEESAHARMKLGTVLLSLNRPADAAAEFARGLASGSSVGDPLSVDEQAAGWYLSGVAALRLRNLEDGRHALEKALQIRPGMREARELLGRLPR